MSTTVTTTTRTRKSPAALGIAAFLVLVGSLFFWLSAFSVPFIKSIYYVRTRENGMKFGNFGWCLEGNEPCYQHVGYAWDPQIMGGTRLTGSLILVAFTAAFGSLAFFSLLHSVKSLRSGALSFFLTLFSAFLATLSFLLVVICFGVAHHRFEDDTLQPKYGAAFILVIIGWLLLLAAIPFVIIGWFRGRHYRHQMPTTTTTTTTRRKWF